jgi:hypothetical protein
LLTVNSKDTDVFTISFYAWIKAKIDKDEVYATCLDYIRVLSQLPNRNEIAE